MEYKLLARGFELTDAIRNYLDKRLEKIDRVFDEGRIISADARFDKERGFFKFEFTVHVPDAVIRVEDQGNDPYALIDTVVDSVERKLKSYKEIREKRSRRGSLRREVVAESSPDSEEEDVTDLITKRKRFMMKPMILEEAVDQMKLLGHSFFVFRNADTGDINVLYVRNDGSLGLIELVE